MSRDFGLKDNELAMLRALFESVPELEAVYVFGSRARGDHKGTSDVDLAVRTSTDHSRVTSRLKGELEEMNIIHRFDVANLADIKEGSDFARRVHKEMRPLWRRGWRSVAIYDLARWINGLAFRDITFANAGIPVVKINELKYGVTDQTRFTTQEFDEDCRLKKGDLLFAWSGSPDTSIDAFIYRFDEGWLNQHIFKVVPNEDVDNDFFYYLLKANRPRFVEIARDKQTTGLGHVTVGDLKHFMVEIPPLPEQKRIAEILSSLDDKIELNRQMNKTLEQIAQALFKHWFIDFEFPNEEGKPYKSSGGKMVESEMGLVPEGWIYDAIGNHVKIVGGTTPSTTNPEFWNGDYHWTSPKDLSVIDGIYLLTTDKKITEAGLGQIGSGSLAEGTLLMSSRAPIGYLAFAAIPVAINQGYIAFLKDGSLPNSYMYFWLKMNMALVIASANGSTFLEISKSNFREINALIPSKELVELFDATIMPLMAAIHNGEFKNQKLDDVRERAICNLIS